MERDGSLLMNSVIFLTKPTLIYIKGKLGKTQMGYQDFEEPG